MLVGFWYTFPRPNHALGPEVPFLAGAFAAWWALLTFRSGVAPSRFGNNHFRSTSPIAFWFEVVFLGGLSLVFFLMGVSW
jgi:hypothetical protein